MPRPRTIEDKTAYMREYMRGYRQGKRLKVPKEKPAPKRVENLDRSKPVGKNVKLDRPGYMRRYMRWSRAEKGAKQ